MLCSSKQTIIQQKEVHNMKTKYIIAIALLCLLLAGSTGASARTITVGHVAGVDYWTIQEAVDAAAIYGDTIQVLIGTYTENVVISKSLILCGEDNNRTIIHGDGDEVVINVTANNVTIRGFTIQDGEDAGIKISSRNCAVIDNIIKVGASSYPGRDKGIYLSSATGTTISGNTITSDYSNNYGIYLTSATTMNSIYHNNIMCWWGGYDSSGSNGWDNGSASGGNYWDGYPGYSGVDSDGDGIGDTPYCNIYGDMNAQDNYPFMEQDGWKIDTNDTNTTPTPPPATDSDGDGIADSDDLCPGFDDTHDFNGNGIPDCVECGGSTNPPPVTINLHEGWNLIGWTAEDTDDIGDSLSGLDWVGIGTYENGIWKSYVPGYGGSLSNMQLGHGYFINMSDSGTLTMEW